MPDNSHLHTPNLLAFEILRLADTLTPPAGMEAAAASLSNATIFSIGHFVAPWLPQHARRSASASCFRALRLVDVGDDGHGSDVEQPERRNNEPPGIPMRVDDLGQHTALVLD